MKEIVLTHKDLSLIKAMATKEWVNKSHKTDNFVCECYLNAFISYLNGNKMMVIDGKIYVKETPSEDL